MKRWDVAAVRMAVAPLSFVPVAKALVRGGWSKNFERERQRDARSNRAELRLVLNLDGGGGGAGIDGSSGEAWTGATGIQTWVSLLV